MADVTITYAGNEIASMDDSGTKTLQTQGKYCTDNITVEYTKSGGGGSYTVTIGLINPRSDSAFVSCTVLEWDGQFGADGQTIGSISSPTGSTTVTTTTGGIALKLIGGYVVPPPGLYEVLLTGMIGYVHYTEGVGSQYMYFAVSGDGTINVSDIDWDD